MALKAFPRLQELPVRVLENHFVECLFSVPARIDPLWGIRDALCKPEENKLHEAHKAAVKLYGLCVLSCVNTAFRDSLAPQKLALRGKIVTLLTQIHDENSSLCATGGASSISTLVENGNYLFVLKVYFMGRPEALHNYAGDKQRRCLNGRNVLHSAVAPNSGLVSRSFVQFVIKMDDQHQLGLHLEKDQPRGGQLPLEACRSAIFGWQRSEKQAAIAALEPLLVAASPAAVELAAAAAVAEPQPLPPPEPVLAGNTYLDADRARLWLQNGVGALGQDLPILRMNWMQSRDLADFFTDLPPLDRLPLDDGDEDPEPSCLSRCCACLGEILSSILECIRNLFATS